MTDIEELFTYRLRQAEETLNEAERMLESDFSVRSVVNRSYYSMFYAILALFIRLNVVHKTSKHSGVIGIFDREFIRTGKIESHFSKMLHRLFEQRQQADYKELVELPRIDGVAAVENAREFVMALKQLIAHNESKGALNGQ